MVPGPARRVVLAIPRSGFEAHLHGRWKTVPGTCHVLLGPSAEDLPIVLATPAP